MSQLVNHAQKIHESDYCFSLSQFTDAKEAIRYLSQDRQFKE
jgi:hypothetical protein